MNCFTSPVTALSEYGYVCEAVKKGKTPVLVSGMADVLKSNFAEAVAEGLGARQRVIVTYSEQRARELLLDMKLYDKNAIIYPAKDIMFFAADVRGNAITAERIKVLKKILDNESCTIICTLDAAILKVLPINDILDNILLLKQGDSLDLNKLRLALTALGYRNTAEVTDPGQFSVRGGIIDIFSLTDDAPVRIELWGDEIDNIRYFDPETQRTLAEDADTDEVEILPAAEMILDDDRLNRGRERIEKECEKRYKALRKEMKTEQAARLMDSVNELKENLDVYGGAASIDSYINYFYDKTESFFDYFGKNTLFFIDEPERLAESGEAVTTEFRESMTARLEGGYILSGQADVIYDYKQVLAGLEKRKTVMLSLIETKTGPMAALKRFDVTGRNVNSYNNDFDLLVKDMKAYKKSKSKVVLACANSLRAGRIAKDLSDNGINAVAAESFERIPAAGEVVCVPGALRRGFEYPLIGFAVISESDVFGEKQKKKRAKKASTVDGASITSFSELHPGDYVIHENHGLGIYKGIEKIESGGIARDYLKIEYDGGTALFVPVSSLSLISKYSGGGSAKPHINKLGGTEWKKTKTKVKNSVNEVAKDLVELYAKRQNEQGYRFSADTEWQREFEETFPYEETDDQVHAIEDVKRDMESAKIMDRLICGDVGFGKTEIAIRAAFKAVMDGKQVAILVPTTILAQQHYNTFVQRMRDFPVSVDILSRFRTDKETKGVLDRLSHGMLDIVIGTHKLLGKSVKFKNLGLLIVDEEQRFGVRHKEKIKQLRENVDVLTLSATPIPRTLHMSLSGIRDMSVLEEAPVDRQPIQTYVLEHNDEIIREAILREMARGGQVYYVRNRINGLPDLAAKIQAMVPDAEVAYAYGQMDKRELERIMFDFINGDIDVLVSTTIIETGIDIPNVNTMIIDDADKMGLSQLYQLRGRVGRSSKTAYAFMMYKRDRMLPEVAEKRLAAIREFTDLGSGFKIAMRDLEIRGAGNILGESQSGHMETVGYDLYCKMLNEAVRTIKGEKVNGYEYDTVMNLDVDAFIPASYIKNETQKLEMYKRIATIESATELLDMKDELIDRYGDMPAGVDNLTVISYLRFMAHRAYITEVHMQEKNVVITMFAHADIDNSKIPAFLNTYGNKLSLKKGDDGAVKFTYKLDSDKPTKGAPKKTIVRGNGKTMVKATAAATPVKSDPRLTELRNLLGDFVKLLPDEKEAE